MPSTRQSQAAKASRPIFKAWLRQEKTAAARRERFLKAPAAPCHVGVPTSEFQVWLNVRAKEGAVLEVAVCDAEAPSSQESSSATCSASTGAAKTSRQVRTNGSVGRPRKPEGERAKRPSGASTRARRRLVQSDPAGALRASAAKLNSFRHLQKLYHSLIRAHHPDKSGDPLSHTRAQELNAAWCEIKARQPPPQPKRARGRPSKQLPRDAKERIAFLLRTLSASKLGQVDRRLENDWARGLSSRWSAAMRNEEATLHRPFGPALGGSRTAK